MQYLGPLQQNDCVLEQSLRLVKLENYTLSTLPPPPVHPQNAPGTEMDQLSRLKISALPT